MEPFAQRAIGFKRGSFARSTAQQDDLLFFDKPKLNFDLESGWRTARAQGLDC